MSSVPWRIRGQAIETAPESLVMGIVNVTPDSFSDGGRFLDTGRAVEHSLGMLTQGARILDFGGESTRPGADPVEEVEEIHRVIPVLSAVRRSTQALLSIDTMKASVARAAVEAGADIINDITGLAGDAGMIPLAAETDVGLVVMHMQGQPRTMQADPRYHNVVDEVKAYFERRLQTLESAGIDRRRVALDPGFGFGKTVEHNLELARRLPELQSLGQPILVGVSRKSMIAKVTGAESMEDRFWPTVALTTYLREQGATIHRVHDVAANSQALRMVEAIAESGTPTVASSTPA